MTCVRYIHTCIHTYIHKLHTYRQTDRQTDIHTQHTYIPLHYITLHTHTYMHACVHAYIHIHYITLHYITLHYITLHYITFITLHYITLHYHTYIHVRRSVLKPKNRAFCGAVFGPKNGARTTCSCSLVRPPFWDVSCLQRYRNLFSFLPCARQQLAHARASLPLVLSTFVKAERGGRDPACKTWDIPTRRAPGRTRTCKT